MCDTTLKQKTTNSKCGLIFVSYLEWDLNLYKYLNLGLKSEIICRWNFIEIWSPCSYYTCKDVAYTRLNFGAVFSADMGRY